MFVRAGEWNTRYANETLPHQDRSLSRIVIHPDFNNLTLFNDIALLKLDQPVLYANNVQPICLPKPEDRFFGQNCIATGWGQDAFGKSSTTKKIIIVAKSDFAKQTKPTISY